MVFSSMMSFYHTPRYKGVTQKRFSEKIFKKPFFYYLISFLRKTVTPKNRLSPIPTSEAITRQSTCLTQDLMNSKNIYAINPSFDR